VSVRWRRWGGEGIAVAALVLRHHERLDGGGYHRYTRANDLSPAARILAAAEFFQTVKEERPYRAGLSEAAAAAKLPASVQEGKLCADAVEGSALTPEHNRTSGGADAREIEVQRLIAAGHTAKEAARELEIAPKTADNHAPRVIYY
jgi:HD-GYP domain-containing protein (c-di-GMP phosphodiesterase class II)